MKLIYDGKNRVLLKDNADKVSVNDGDWILYTGIYYKTINDIVQMVEIETTFIGIVLMDKWRHGDGILGIYVEPLFIWNKMREGWNKIINYKPPDRKYFLYPHLLLVQDRFLHTCQHVVELPKNIEQTLDLCM